MCTILETFTNRVYGEYKCSCGCGKILNCYANCIGAVDDINGDSWRMFSPECWERICKEWDLEEQSRCESTFQESLNHVYNSYSVSEGVK